jgi:uncharacterized Zn finger protein
MADARRRKADSESPHDWASLRWDDLDAWAGGRSVSRGRSYQRQGRVSDLAVSPDGKLLATIMGRERYVASAWLSGDADDPLRSECTCPVGFDGCKHAVALVAEYLDQLGRGKKPPVAREDDPRWEQLEDGGRTAEFDEDDEIPSETDGATPRRARAVPRTRAGWDEKIRQHIFSKGREELAELVWSLTQRFGELRDEFRERILLGEGDVDRLVAQARKELHRVTSQEAWRSGWTGEGNIPDYGKLRHRLERLIELGHPDAVAHLGPEILQRGMDQVGQSHDEGETAAELGDCLRVVFDAVAKSSWAPAQRLLFWIDAQLQDDYGVLDDESAAILHHQKYSPSDWSTVADELARRLSVGRSTKRKGAEDDDEEGEEDDDVSRNYQRDQISNWLTTALTRAGRGEEVLAIYESEARANGSYERLVKHLIEQDRGDDAVRWATEGIAKTAAKLSGIAADLAGQLCELARSRKQWDVVAAHAAQLFFQRPSRDGFAQLVAAADQAGCKEPVRRLAQHFLETGTPPIEAPTGTRGKARPHMSADWPLPLPDYLIPLLETRQSARTSAQPHFDVLIDISIAEQRSADVLHWYDKMCGARTGTAYGNAWNGPDYRADSVAEAVAKSHPDRAIAIYRKRVEQNLGQASVGAYETVASYLRKLKPIMHSIGRDQEWKQTIEEIRLRYRNRPRLVEILDRLEERPILAKPKRRG